MGQRCVWCILITFGLYYFSYTTAQGLMSASSSSDGSSLSGAGPFEDTNPCAFRGQFLLHEQGRRLDACTLCTCRNGTTTCDKETCPSEAGCRPDEVVEFPDECCPRCPFNMVVRNTHILYEETGIPIEGGTERIRFALDIAVESRLSSRTIHGENLWKLGAWVSGNKDGSGRKYSHSEQLFNGRQAAKKYDRPDYPPWKWTKLRYDVPFLERTCDDYGYFCVEFGQADEPLLPYELPFTFRAVYGEQHRLVDCVPLSHCRGGFQEDGRASESVSEWERRESYWLPLESFREPDVPRSPKLDVCRLPTPPNDVLRISVTDECEVGTSIEYSCDGAFVLNGTREAECFRGDFPFRGLWIPSEFPWCEAYGKIDQLLEESLSLEVGSPTDEIRSAAEILVIAASDAEFIADNRERAELITESLEAVSDAENTSPAVTKPVVRAVNNLMEHEEALINGKFGSGRVVAAMEQQISNRQSASRNFTRVLDNIGVHAVKINPRTVTSPTLNFGTVSSHGETPTLEKGLSDGSTFLSQDEAPVNETVTIISVSSNVVKHYPIPDVTVPISFFVYGNSKLFDLSGRLNESNTSSSHVRESIASQIITAKIELPVRLSNRNTTVTGNNVTVISKFLWNRTLGELERIESRECVSWSYDKEAREGSWSTEGCRRQADVGDLTVCECDRLSSFAVLIRIRKEKGVSPAPLYWITLIGSIISCVCLVACIITFLTLENIRGKLSTYIHINLSISLLGFYLSFLLSGPAFRNNTACAVASAAIHYFCLATTIWMSVEALNLYWVFSKANITDTKRFIAVACAIGYGVPAVPTVLVAVLDSVIIDGTADYCFIHPGVSLYVGFLGIIALLFLFNITVFVWLIWKALCRRIMTTQIKDHAKRDEFLRRIRHGILFWFILGMSWIFAAFAAVDVKTFTFEYLYSIFTAMQGIIMFLLLCVANPEFRRALSKFQRGSTQESSFSGPATTAVSGTTTKSTSPKEEEGDASQVELTAVTPLQS